MIFFILSLSNAQIWDSCVSQFLSNDLVPECNGYSTPDFTSGFLGPKNALFTFKADNLPDLKLKINLQRTVFQADTKSLHISHDELAVVQKWKSTIPDLKIEHMNNIHILSYGKNQIFSVSSQDSGKTNISFNIQNQEYILIDGTDFKYTSAKKECQLNAAKIDCMQKQTPDPITPQTCPKTIVDFIDTHKRECGSIKIDKVFVDIHNQWISSEIAGVKFGLSKSGLQIPSLKNSFLDIWVTQNRILPNNWELKISDGSVSIRFKNEKFESKIVAGVIVVNVGSDKISVSETETKVETPDSCVEYTKNILTGKRCAKKEHKSEKPNTEPKNEKNPPELIKASFIVNNDKVIQNKFLKDSNLVLKDGVDIKCNHKTTDLEIKLENFLVIQSASKFEIIIEKEIISTVTSGKKYLVKENGNINIQDDAKNSIGSVEVGVGESMFYAEGFECKSSTKIAVIKKSDFKITMELKENHKEYTVYVPKTPQKETQILADTFADILPTDKQIKNAQELVGKNVEQVDQLEVSENDCTSSGDLETVSYEGKCALKVDTRIKSQQNTDSDLNATILLSGSEQVKYIFNVSLNVVVKVTQMPGKIEAITLEREDPNADYKETNKETSKSDSNIVYNPTNKKAELKPNAEKQQGTTLLQAKVNKDECTVKIDDKKLSTSKKETTLSDKNVVIEAIPNGQKTVFKKFIPTEQSSLSQEKFPMHELNQIMDKAQHSTLKNQQEQNGYPQKFNVGPYSCSCNVPRADL